VTLAIDVPPALGLPNPFIVIPRFGWRSVLMEITAMNRRMAERPKFLNPSFFETRKDLISGCKFQLVQLLYNT